jgi:hypothetical protein
MTAIPAQSSVWVTVAMPPPSGAGREEESEALVSLGGGVFSSPVQPELEEDEGAIRHMRTWRSRPGCSLSPRGAEFEGEGD